MAPSFPSEQPTGTSGLRYTLEVHSGQPGRPLNAAERLAVKQRAQQLEGLSLRADLRDDRFASTDWPSETWLALFALIDDQPVAYLGGELGGGAPGEPIHLDLLTVPALAASTDTPPDPDELASVARALFDQIDRIGQPPRSRDLVLWSRPESPVASALAASRDFTPYRALHQLRCVLPVELSPHPPALTTRSFVVGRDEAAVTQLNNRAFASHPSQGSQPADWLIGTRAEPWFDPDGLRLYENPEDPNELIGFCWTKVHPPTPGADGRPGEPIGEIFVIGIDPRHHGEGLGVPMTMAGLDWLAEQGLRNGMLYVEADNAPALRTYERIGFRHHRTDRAWQRQLR